MAVEGVLTLEIATPGQAPRHCTAAEVTVPGEQGVFSVLPGHTAVLTTLTHGVLIAYAESGDTQFYAIHGGFAEILNDTITVMAITVEDGESIDPERARAARDRAEERLKKPGLDVNVARAEAALARALARIQAQDRSEYN